MATGICICIIDDVVYVCVLCIMYHLYYCYYNSYLKTYRLEDMAVLLVVKFRAGYRISEKGLG